MEETHLLLESCEEGDIDSVVNLLDQGVDVNSTDCEELTALQVAAGNGHESIVRLLLMRGASLDQANIYGWTALLHAARNGHTACVSLLIQHQADINAKNRLGSNAVVLAARGGHLQCVKLLIEVGTDISLNTGIGSSTCEFTALQAAAHHGHDAVVRYLINRGSDVSYRTPSTGINGLMLAALNGHVTTAQILIENQANPNHTNVNGHTPLEVAAISGKREVRGFLDRKTSNKPRSNSEDSKPDIIQAAKNGNIQRIQEALEEDISQRDACSPQDGATPLMFAAMTGRQDIAQLLVDKDCDINKQDSVSGWTALMQATYHGKKNVAKFLINVGADVMIQAKNGCTAFDMASLIEDVDTELYRLLANKAVQASVKNGSMTENLTATAKKSRTWSSKSHKNGVVPSVNGEDLPKPGLKAWWNRMSNRFRNLKLGRTFNLNTNRLVPLPAEVASSNPAETQSENSLPPSRNLNHSSMTPMQQTATPLVPHRSLFVENSSGSSTVSNLSIYETLLMDTKKSVSMYTLGIPPQHSPIQDATLKPVIPPFLPPPTFETDRPKMPPSASKKSINTLPNTSSTLTSKRPIQPPMKLLQSYSMQNIASASTSPSASTKFQHSTNASPSSSSGASGLNSSAGASSGKSHGPSSASSSTLTAGSDTLNRSGTTDALFTPVSHRVIPVRSSADISFKRLSSTHTSPSSSMSSSSLTPRRHSRGKSGSSRDSASTLTPSPSPTPKPQELNAKINKPTSGPGEDGDLGGILKNLSLERYQPIFEEQEVDMEAFLTLSDGDLRELGISHGEPRRQILAAITQLNSGKGRTRQQLQDTMSNYTDTLSSRHSYAPSVL